MNECLQIEYDISEAKRNNTLRNHSGEMHYGNRVIGTLTPNRMYVAMTEPAMVAKPPVITAWSSDFVMSPSKGFTSNGASV